MTICRWALVLCGLISLLASHAAETPITLTDWTGRGFINDLVTYTIEAPAASRAKLRLYDATGALVPIQLGEVNGKTTVSFIASLPAGEAVRYTLRDDGKGDLPNTPVAVTEADGALALSNGLLAVRLPAVGQYTYPQPVAANTLPAPILAFKSGAGAWLGAGSLLTSAPVSGMTVTVAQRGPVYAEVRYALAFANGGFYRATIRVEHQVPLVKIDEEYDQKRVGGGDFWQLDLTKGWQAQQCEVASVNRNGSPDPGRVMPVERFGVTPTPMASPWCINPDNSWGPRTYFGLTGTQGDAPVVAGMVPLAKGAWRRYNAVEIHTPDSKQFALRFPMGVRPASWMIEVSSDVSPFSTGQHDPALPATYGRRVWGLMLAQPVKSGFMIGGSGKCGPFGSARMYYGCPSLDTYKNYVLEWPDTQPEYPRVFLRKDFKENYRKALDAAPLGEIQKHYYALSRSEEDAKLNLELLQPALDWWVKYVASTSNAGHGNGGVQVLALADNVLAWPNLPPGKRREIRAKLALITYLTVEPDLLAWHAGTHMGNPNMPLGAYGAVPSYMALLPDHPMHSAWRDWVAEWIEYSIGKNIAPGGGWFEYGSYGLHGYGNIKRGLFGLHAMGAKNLDRLNAYNRGFWDAMLNNLSPVDPRYRARVMPGDANSGPMYAGDFLEAAGLVARHDTGLAAHLQWGWLAGGKNFGDVIRMKEGLASEHQSPLLARPDVQPVEPQLTSRIFPGVGVFFRAHQGPQETFMYFRSGFHWSHWNANQGHMVLYSKGNVLIPGQPYQYYGTRRPQRGVPGFAWLHSNFIRFGHPENEMEYAWPDSNIVDHAFGPTVDYAWSSTGYPDWYITPGRDLKWNGGKPTHRLLEGTAQQEGAFSADRQIVFLKGKTATSPNYFVVRDTVNGPGKLAQWWNMNLLGRKEWITQQGNTIHADTAYPTKLDLVFAREPKGLEMAEDEPQETGHKFWNGPAFGTLWKEGEDLPSFWVDKNGKPMGTVGKNVQGADIFEQHVMLRLPGAPGDEFCYLLYPRGEGEAAPKVTALAPGALKVQTAEGTDYVFVSTTPMRYTGEGVTFEGCVGTVRLRGKEVITALLSGSGQVAYKGMGVKGDAPAEKSFPTGKGKMETVAAKHSIAYTPSMTGHTAVAPGVMKRSEKGVTEYLVNSAHPVTCTDGPVTIQARTGAVSIAGNDVRVVVTDTGYASVTVGQVAVRGMGPFDLTFTPDRITGRVDGPTRTLVVSTPPQVTRAMCRLDGVRYYCGIPDEPSPYRAVTTPQFSVAIGTTDGPHTVEITQWTCPGVPPASPQATITIP